MGHSVIVNLGKGLRAICGAGVDSIQESGKGRFGVSLRLDCLQDHHLQQKYAEPDLL